MLTSFTDNPVLVKGTKDTRSKQFQGDPQPHLLFLLVHPHMDSFLWQLSLKTYCVRALRYLIGTPSLSLSVNVLSTDIACGERIFLTLTPGLQAILRTSLFF